MNINLIDYHADVTSPELKLYYKGPFGPQVIGRLTGYLRDEFGSSGKAVRKLFAIIVELSQNIANYSAETDFFGDYIDSTGIGVLTIYETEEFYVIRAGNLVRKEQFATVQQACELINQSDQETLRNLKKDVRRRELPANARGAGTGLIQIALKAENRVEPAAKAVDDQLLFMTLSTKVDKPPAVL